MTYIPKTFKSKALGAAAACSLMLAAAGSASADPFLIDLGATNGGAGPGFNCAIGIDLDCIAGNNDANGNDELQFNIQVNTITVEGFNGGVGVSVGDTFDFTDVGLANVTQFLPLPSIDTEQFNQFGGWELNADFDLEGTATVTNFVLGDVRFDFVFTAGTIDIWYDESIDAAITVGAENVYSGSVTGGAGDADQTIGGVVTNAGQFNISFDTTSLLAGFWLKSDGVTEYDDLVMALADGNINETDTSVADNGDLIIDANSDGSFKLVPEPGSLALFGLGLLGLALRRKSNA